MLYIPDTFNVPEKERALLQAYVAGNFHQYNVKLKELEGEELSLPYIINLVKRVANDKQPSYYRQLLIVGASHCLPCAWTEVSVASERFTVVPMYYMDLAISTFTRYPESVVSFLQQVFGFKDFITPVIVTVGGLDLYAGGYLEHASAEVIEEYCETFVRCISLNLPSAYIMPILPSSAIAADLRILVNESLCASSLKYDIPLLPCPDNLPVLDDRHFQPNYLQHILDEFQ